VDLILVDIEPEAIVGGGLVTLERVEVVVCRAGS
jgi:hypothetical protein